MSKKKSCSHKDDISQKSQQKLNSVEAICSCTAAPAAFCLQRFFETPCKLTTKDIINTHYWMYGPLYHHMSTWFILLQRELSLVMMIAVTHPMIMKLIKKSDILSD